jgi:hypothetical protein
MTLLGQDEWQRLKPALEPFDIDPALAVRWLGCGYALTQFIMAPAMPSGDRREAVFSLGALVNLMVVVCDRLLDSGRSIEEVLPRAELLTGGGPGSPVMVMLREYLRQHGDMPGLRRIVGRMFEAEIATVRMGDNLPRREWRRKCCLPFVLMGLPSNCHPGWLYRLGRFFGALDDAVDLEEDRKTRQPNYWNNAPVAPAVLGTWGEQVLSRWDKTVPAIADTVIYRESFLNLVWAWLV